MQQGSSVSKNNAATQQACTFCQHSSIATYILKETPNFLLVTDHAPLVEGHLLIIPKHHYACYGDAPGSLDTELHTLKREVRQFFLQHYAPVTYWEHGVFRQTVFHAHLHCFPFGEIEYDLSANLHNLVVSSQDDIRSWYSTQGHYFYLEMTRNALLFQPDVDKYFQVVQQTLWSGATARNGHTQWRSAQQRLAEGGALISATIEKWRSFQQQGGPPYAD